MIRDEARQRILDAANRNTERVFTGCQINAAVHKVRNRRLVSTRTLVAAGFNPHGPRQPRSRRIA